MDEEARTDGEIKKLKREEWLREQYCEQGKTAQEIAGEVGTSISPVLTWMEKHDIETTPTRSIVRHPDHLSHRVIGEMELNRANCLHDGGIDYAYESLEIEYADGRTYIPDFVTENYIIECKGRDWGEVYDKEFTAEHKAKPAMRQLDDREYVVVGVPLLCDIHIPWEERETIRELF